MEVKTLTVDQLIEKYLFERLQEIAPGKYVLAPFLQRVKSSLRFDCNHLKGGRHLRAGQKDWNLSFFTFATGISEIKCLYGCGLKLRSDQASLSLWSELHGLFQNSTNTTAASEFSAPRKDPGPVPTYTDEDRARIQEREENFWKWALANPEQYREQYGNVYRKHPDPIPAPESIIRHNMAQALVDSKNAVSPITKAMVTFQDRVPALEPVKKHTKIRKARKTQSRRKAK